MKELIKSILGDYTMIRINQLKQYLFSDESITAKKRSCFYSTFINENDLCFDVGANIGNRIQPLLNLGANVVAVEPQESCRKFLTHRFGTKIKLVAKGLGENEEIKDFYIANSNTLSSFSNDWINQVKNGRFKHNTWNKTVKVEMTTLDQLIRSYGVPSFIKIDVEGYELEVLKGLTSSVNMISLEYAVPEQTAKLIACINRIEKNDKYIECNYSIGESMDFALKKWYSVENMKNHIQTISFANTEFGDIYVRQKR
jgi:FkbM family methyltransferase